MASMKITTAWSLKGDGQFSIYWIKSHGWVAHHRIIITRRLEKSQKWKGKMAISLHFPCGGEVTTSFTYVNGEGAVNPIRTSGYSFSRKIILILQSLYLLWMKMFRLLLFHWQTNKSRFIDLHSLFIEINEGGSHIFPFVRSMATSPVG